MSRTERSKEAHRRNSNEGTAARTRPLSFEEIMLRRKKKLTAGTEEASGSRERSAKHDAKVASDHAEPDEAHKSTKVPKDTVKWSTRRMEETVSRREGDRLEGSSRKMEDLASKREGDRLEGKEKGKLDDEANIKAKSSYSKSGGDRKIKTEKQSHYRSRTGDRLEADSEKEFEKKRPKDKVEKDRGEERDRKPKVEGKRKHHGYNDERSRSEIDGSNLKKHDSGRSRDEYSERNDRKKELSKPYYEERRSKRRRSRSREYERERDKRSVSLSPRANKRSYVGWDYEESSFPSFKDKSRRKYSDGDKQRSSGNSGYAGGQYRKHGSGLGGYSPRKRRTEAAVRTPSPTIRSPEKKTATWDQPPPGANHAGFGSALANFQSSVMPATAKSQPLTLKETVSVAISASVDSVQLTQATRPMRRLYIENLPPSASEKTVIACLNDFLLSSGVNHIQGADPCISCLINKEKCQALVEFLTPEDATAAVSFDGRSLSGSILKIRRPKDFVDAATGAPEKPVEEAKAISDVVKDSPHKIFIGGISKALSSDILMEIVSAFGVLRAYRYKFNEELNGPCAFLEYVDHSITQKACAGLNGMKLGGCVLTAVQALPDAYAEENTESAPSYSIPMHVKPLLSDSTKVLQLKNVFNREEFLLLSESELDEIMEDIRLECGRFGTVKSVNIVRYTSTVETAAKASEPETIGGSTKLESRTASPRSDSGEDENVPATNDAKEPRDARDLSEDGQSNIETPTKDTDKESASSSPSDSVTVLQDSQQLNEPSGDPLTKLDENADAKIEERYEVENDMVSKSSAKLEEADTMIAEDADLNCSAAKQEASRGDGKHMSMENVNSKTAAGDGANLSKDDNEPMSIENGNSSSNAVDKAVDKAGVSNGDGNHQAQDSDVFEPGSVLVEFLRKEATCMAAHCLHGRTYGERIVTAGYVPHDLYLVRFPR